MLEVRFLLKCVLVSKRSVVNKIQYNVSLTDYITFLLLTTWCFCYWLTCLVLRESQSPAHFLGVGFSPCSCTHNVVTIKQCLNNLLKMKHMINDENKYITDNYVQLFPYWKQLFPKFPTLYRCPTWWLSGIPSNLPVSFKEKSF